MIALWVFLGIVVGLLISVGWVVWLFRNWRIPK